MTPSGNVLPKSCSSGFLLVTLLLSLSVITMLVIGMVAMAIQDAQAAYIQTLQVKAYYLAEGGVDGLLHDMRQDRLPDDGTEAEHSLPEYLYDGSYTPDVGEIIIAKDRRMGTMRRLTVTAITAPQWGRRGIQTLTAYVRDRMDPFIYDTLVYSSYFWSDRVLLTGADSDGPQPEGQPETGRGNIYISDQWGNVTHPPIPEGLPVPEIGEGYQSTFVATRLIQDPSVFPVPRFRMTGPNSVTAVAQRQKQRDPVTGDYLCRDTGRDCQDDSHADNRKDNYYGVTRLARVNTGADPLPIEFWQPTFTPVLNPITKQPIINPLTGRPVLQRAPPDPTKDEPNIVTLDFMNQSPALQGVAELHPSQRLVGGFLAVAQPVSATKVYDSGSHGYLSWKVTSDQAVLNTIIYQHDPQADVNLYSWNWPAQPRYDFSGAVWGGWMTDIWAPDLSGAGPPTVTYNPLYADAVKRMELPAEVQLLAVQASAGEVTGN